MNHYTFKSLENLEMDQLKKIEQEKLDELVHLKNERYRSMAKILYFQQEIEKEKQKRQNTGAEQCDTE